MELTEQDCPNVPAHMRIALNAWVAEYDELRQYKIDAQAIIAALQAQLTQLDRTVADVYAQRDGLQKDLAQRTAELEAAKAIQAIDLKNNNAYREQVANLHAELERVRGQYAELGKMVLALPKVEGAVVVSNGYVKDSTRRHALFGADEDAALYAVLLQHRQGME